MYQKPTFAKYRIDCLLIDCMILKHKRIFITIIALQKLGPKNLGNQAIVP